MDIASFFPSVTNEYVYWLWHRVLNCSSQIASILTQLTSFERHLPQGASTSTPLANILIAAIDTRIRAECARLGITYSTWVDDLAFSGQNARQVIPTVISALAKAGLRISRKKIKIMGPATRKVLNGIILGRKPGVPREVRSRIRSGIHKLAIGAVRVEDQTRYLRSLIARIRQVETINPTQIRKLRQELIGLLQSTAIPTELKRISLKQLGQRIS